MDFHWYVSVSYQAKTGYPDQVYWEVVRDDEMRTCLDAGRTRTLEEALEEAGNVMDSDVIAHIGPRR